MSPHRDRTLRLSKHAALKQRAEGFVLVLPERAIRIGGSGGEILRLCESGRTAGTVITAMQERYPDSDEIAAEVGRFLDEMLDLGGLVETDRGLLEDAR